MTKPAHTPGPWRVEPLEWNHGASIAIVADGQIVATISPENEDEEPGLHTATRGPHDEANARLIAASPDLLKALEAAEGAIEEATDIMYYEDGQPATALESWEIERAYFALCGILVEVDQAITAARGQP